MLVEKNGEKYIVENFFLRKDDRIDYLAVIDIRTHSRSIVALHEVSILDGRFPPNFSMKRHVESDGSVSFIFSIDNGFTDVDFWNKYEDDDPAARKIYYEFLDGLTTLHKLPKIPHPEIKIPEKETQEQRRQKALSDELDEYLRIGEEISRENSKKY